MTALDMREHPRPNLLSRLGHRLQAGLPADSKACFVGGEAVNRAGRFFLLLYVGSAVGPDAFGGWVLGAVLGTLLANTADGGLNLAATSAVAAGRAPARGLLASLWLVAACPITLTVVAGGIAALPLGVLSVAVIIALSGALDSATYLLLSPLRGLGRMRQEGAIRAASGVVLAGGGIAIAIAGQPADAVWIYPAVSVGSVAAAGVVNLQAFGPVLPRWDARLCRPLARAAVPVLASTALMLVYFRADAILLSQLKGAHETGLYGAAYNTAFGGVFLAVTFGRARLPALAASSNADLKREYARSLRLSLLAGVAVSVLLLFASPLFLIAYGTSFDDALTPYLILAVCQALLFVTQLNYICMVGRQRADAAALSVALALVVNVTANLFLIPRLGATGAAIAMLLSEGVLLAVQSLLMARLLKPEALPSGSLYLERAA